MRGFLFGISFVLALEALSAPLGHSFVQGTQLGRDVLRLTLRGVLPFPNAFVEHPHFVADGWRVMLEHDVKLWSLLIYVMPDLETAFAHQQRVPYPLTQGLYLINPQFAADADLSQIDFAALAQAPQTNNCSL